MSNNNLEFAKQIGNFGKAQARKAEKKAARKKSKRAEAQHVRVFEPRYESRFMKGVIKPNENGYLLEVRYKREEPRIVEYPGWVSPRNFILPQFIAEAIRIMTKKNKSALQTLENQLQADKALEAREFLQNQIEKWKTNAV